ncbi:MAG: MBL fold metallo-hydrolase [Syntrophobacterales bacterium]|nr:MBL fold metallo-hydrolase [Syntrophobacterales bacterium]
MEEKIFWLGHASIRIEADRIVYIDPWKVKGEPKADLILISHSHHDHFSPGDVKKLCKADTVIVGPGDCTAQLTGNVRTVAPGDILTVGGMTIEAVPAYNPRKPYHPEANRWLGFVLTVEDKRIYFAGDTDLIPAMQDIRADIAILPVGGTYTMTAAEAAEAATLINPALAIPIHWGDIVGTRADAEKFRRLAKVPVEIKNPSS